MSCCGWPVSYCEWFGWLQVRGIECLSLSPRYLEGQFEQELVEGTGSGEFQPVTDCSSFVTNGDLNSDRVFGSRLQGHVRQSERQCKANSRDCRASRQKKIACRCTHEELARQVFGGLSAQVVEALEPVADLACNGAFEVARMHFSDKSLDGSKPLPSQSLAKHRNHNDASSGYVEAVTVVVSTSQEHGQRLACKPLIVQLSVSSCLCPAICSQLSVPYYLFPTVCALPPPNCLCLTICTQPPVPHYLLATSWWL